MKVDQITTASHGRLLDWHQAAVNDPSVARFLHGGGWYQVPADKGSDWETAHFMDAENMGVLTVSFNRERMSASVALYVLNGPSRKAAAFALMRFAAGPLLRRYGMKALAFSIAETNANWSARALTSFGPFFWGREPEAFYDLALGCRVGADCYYVPASKLIRRRLR